MKDKTYTTTSQATQAKIVFGPDMTPEQRAQFDRSSLLINYSKPFGYGEPLLEWAFSGYVHFAWGDEQHREDFESYSGMKLPSPARTPLEAMIDRATGANDAVITAFIEWLIRERWGRIESVRHRKTADQS